MQVTREDAISFLEGACRNWSHVPSLSEEDIGDVATELLRFVSARAVNADPDMLKALKAQEKAENKRESCPECEGEGDWPECGRCSGRFGDAIDLRRAALSKAGES